MSSETLNFGPEWLRNLSHGGGGGVTSPPLSPAVNMSSVSKFKLAKHRYGREEMLALFEEDAAVPASLKLVPQLISPCTMLPLNLTPITMEDQQAFSASVNSETAYRGRGMYMGRTPRGRGQRGRGRGTTESYTRSVSQNEEGGSGYSRTAREFNRRDNWEDRRGVGVRHFDDPPPTSRSKPLRRAELSGNWRDDAVKSSSGPGGDSSEAPPNTNNRTNPGGWRETRSSWRDWSNENGGPGAAPGGGAYRASSNNRSNGPIRRSVSTGQATTPGGGSRYDGANEGNGNNNFMPLWAHEDEAEPEVGVFDSSGAFLPRAGEAMKKGGNNNADNNESNKKQQRRQSSAAASGGLDKIEEQRNHLDSKDSGQCSPPANNTNLVTSTTSAFFEQGKSMEQQQQQPEQQHQCESADSASNGQDSPPTTSSPPITATIKSETNLSATPISNDLHNSDDYVPKSIPNTFAEQQQPKKEMNISELLARTKTNEKESFSPNFDGIAESAIRLVDDPEDHLQHLQQQQQQQQQILQQQHLQQQQVTALQALQQKHQQQQQQHEQLQLDATAQHLKSMFANSQQQNTAAQQLINQATKWFYKDPQNEVQGPFTSQQMADWLKAGYFSSSLLIRRATETHFEPLGDIIQRHGGHIPFVNPNIQTATAQQQQQAALIQQQQNKLLEQQQQQQLQEMRIRSLIQRSKEMQESQMLSYKTVLLQNYHKNPEFLALPPANQQAMLANAIAQYQANLSHQHQQQLTQIIQSTTNPPAVAGRGIVGNAPSIAQAAVVTNSPATAAAAAASTVVTPQQQQAHHQQDSLNPWEVDPAIVRRPSPGATQQEQQHFMQLLKKKTEEQEQRSAMKAREDLELEEKRKLEMQQRIQQEEAVRKAEEARKQRELLLYRKRLEEERLRKEEEEKQKKEDEERLRQKLAKEEEARKKKAADEAERQRKIAKNKKIEEERKRVIEEQRKKREQEEEEKRRKKKEEDERRLKEEEELKKKQLEEENARKLQKQKLKEAQRKKELEDLKNLSLPSHAQWGTGSQQQNSPQQQQSRPTLAELQKIEEAKEREMKERREQERRIQMQQNAKQNSAPVWGGNAAQHLASNVVKTPSLAEIQREEAKKAKQKEEKQQPKKSPAVVRSASLTAAASGSGGTVKWTNGGGARMMSPSTVVSSKPAGQAWGAASTFQQQTAPVMWEHPPSAAPKNDAKLVKQQQGGRNKRRSQQAEKSNVVAMFENTSSSNPAKHSDVFFKWASKEISKIPQVNQLDVPTVFSFLCDVQSPYEVKDYIHEVFGDNQAAKNFGNAFLKKRSEFAQQQQQQVVQGKNNNNSAPTTPSNNNQLSSANLRRSTSGAAGEEDAAAAAANELVTGNTKRGKRRQRKLQKIDPSILGFSVNAASDRVNMGEIDTPRDV